MKPKVSVIIPAYNAAKFIGITINSILNQNLTDFELIVVDDGSQDNTSKVVWNIPDPRIKCFQKENGGQASARNFGLKNALGQYIAYCDHDDLYKENHLHLLADYLDANPDVGMVYSKAVEVSKDGQEINTLGSEFDRRRFEYYCFIVPLMVMHRKACVEKAGLWDEHPDLRFCHEDWDFFLRISDYYQIVFIDQVTVLKAKHIETHFQKSILNLGFITALHYLLKKRLRTFAGRKKQGKVAPFDGYYFHFFQKCINVSSLAEKLRTFKSFEIYNTKVIPLFEDLSAIDKNNLEIWLLLAMLYLRTRKIEKVFEAAPKVKTLLSQRLEVDKEEANLLNSTLKGIGVVLEKTGDKESANSFLEKAKEFPPA